MARKDRAAVRAIAIAPQASPNYAVAMTRLSRETAKPIMPKANVGYSGRGWAWPDKKES
jgi:hypothetical protein